jgi:hypothetical protein
MFVVPLSLCKSPLFAFVCACGCSGFIYFIRGSCELGTNPLPFVFDPCHYHDHYYYHDDYHFIAIAIVVDFP